MTMKIWTINNAFGECLSLSEVHHSFLLQLTRMRDDTHHTIQNMMENCDSHAYTSKRLELVNFNVENTICSISLFFCCKNFLKQITFIKKKRKERIS